MQGSVGFSSFNFFLTLDPIFHSTKSTGTIQSKVRAAEANFSNMMHVFLHSVFNSFINFVVVIITLLIFSIEIGLISLISFLVITTLSFYGNIFLAKVFTQLLIQRRDRYSAISIENLYQNNLIRSTFTTEEQSQKTRIAIVYYLEVRTLMQQVQGLMGLGIRFLFMLTIGAIGYIIMRQIETGQLDIAIGISLLLTYITGAGKIYKVGESINSFVEGVVNLNDLWDYIGKFGKQTYPVVSKEE